MTSAQESRQSFELGRVHLCRDTDRWRAGDDPVRPSCQALRSHSIAASRLCHSGRSLSEGAPPLLLVIGCTSPSLFKYFMGMEGPPRGEVIEGFGNSSVRRNL